MLSSSNNGLMTTLVNDFLKEVPNKQRHFLGKVVETFEKNVDNTDDAPRNYKIKFNILGLPDFQDEWPIAMPLGDMVREVKVDEIVFIYDICTDNMAAHTFFYVPIREGNGEKRFLGIKNYDNELNLTEKNYARFKLPNCEIIFDRTKTEAQDGDDDIEDNQQGIVTIKAGGSEIRVECDMGHITIKGAPGSQFKLDGALTDPPTGTGFSVLNTCPYSGAPHCGNFVVFG